MAGIKTPKLTAKIGSKTKVKYDDSGRTFEPEDGADY